MGDGILTFAKIIFVILASTFGLVLLIMLLGLIFKLSWRIVGNVFRFIGETVSDSLRLVGSILAALLFAPMVLLCIVVGRWSASRHYAGAFSGECKAAGRCVYRLCVGNPARLFGVSSALEGVEKRIPEVVAAAPGKDKPPRRAGQFDGYTIIGSLKGGGSGGKLYIAEPDAIKRAVFDKRNLQHVDQVVIKSFSLSDGSSLPQIVRESRALDAARKLGLVIEHEMAPERFYYVMRYVPGESLAAVTQNLHAMSGTGGLDEQHLRSAMGYGRDLLVALDAYHNAGLWHKDVKPDNIIVDGKGPEAQAHLVDFGLVTPLRSAMTLTTHGTEYFRDPELVRQALRGVKVHQIDGSKFDVYAAGAVMFSVIENSFPAHGGLSQITKKCPESLRWVVRRAMAEYDRRYPSAAAMLADLSVVLNADDPYAVKPAQLPSMSGGQAVDLHQEVDPTPAYPFGADSSAPKVARAGSPRPQSVAGNAGSGTARVGRPKARVHGWWSGKYHVVNAPAPKSADRLEVPLYAARVQTLRSVDDRKPAREQVKSARKRAHQMRGRAQTRMGKHSGRVRRNSKSYSNGPATGAAFAIIVGVILLFTVASLVGGLLLPVLRDRTTSGATERLIVESPKAPDAPNDVVVFHGQNDHAASVPTDTQHGGHVFTEHLPEVKARLLVVNDLPQPVSSEDLNDLRAGTDMLRVHGVTLQGDLVSEEGIDSIAELRSVVGATPIDSPMIAIKIREWIQQHNDLDGVVWIARNPAAKDQDMAILVTERFIWSQQSLDEETPGRMLRVLAGNQFLPDAD